MTSKPVHILHRIGTLHTMKGGPRRAEALKDTGSVHDAAIAWDDAGRIIAAGDIDDVRKTVGAFASVIWHDAGGKTVTPGLIDSHTHAVNAGSRSGDFVMRCEGAEYMDILAAGGGILNSADRTRAASEGFLVEVGRKALGNSLSFGITAIEIKSGYGLDIEAESKILRAAKTLARTQPIRVKTTFLGAHAIPREFKGDSDSYVDIIVKEMLPKIAEERLADFCDVFIEKDVFTVEQGRRILEAGMSLGMKPKVHCDEIVPLGGTEMACGIGALSVDHLIAITDTGIKALAKSETVGCLLPGTSFFLKKPFAPCRKMIDAGCLLALGTDNNPGSSRTENIQWIMTTACLYYGLRPEEALSMVTINAAKALGSESEIGSLEVGKSADFVVWDCPDLAEIPYHHGVSHVSEVFIGGVQVTGRG
jgi:imidazolonepropionase